MAKIFKFDNERVLRKNQASPMDADVWFASQQPLLLWMANKSKEGRNLLCIDHARLERIDYLGAHYASQVNSYGLDGTPTEITTNFRSSPKWSNLICSQWDWFSELAREYYAEMESKNIRHTGLWNPVALWRGFSYGTTTTFYPAVTGNAPFDGVCGRTGVFESLAVIRGSAGNTSTDSASETFFVNCKDGDSSHTFEYLYRSIFGFDTSPMGAGATPSAATFGYVGAGQTTTNFADPTYYNLYGVTPGSASAIANSDYNIANWGSTKFITDVNCNSNFASGGVYNRALNSDGLNYIDPTDYTWIGGRFVGDAAGTSFTNTFSNGAFNVRYSDYSGSGTADCPSLSVTYSPGSGNAFFVLT